MEPPPLIPLTVSYQMPRDVLIRVLFRRVFFRWRRLRGILLILVAAVLFYIAGRDFRVVSYLAIALIFFLPWALYRGIVRLIDQNAQYTAPKTLAFGPAAVVVTGPNFKSELAWSMFKGFSEDADYFYLHLADTGFDSVIPKAAFTAEQQEAFRRYAAALKV